jgi:N-acyl-D-amino-acid deacylase
MIKRFLASLPGIAPALTACAPDVPEPVGTVVVNAQVIDGSGGPAQDINVRIVGERIKTVGDFEPTPGDTVVDANGRVLAPGFIDTHSHHDHGLFERPGALAAVSQGITTIVARQARRDRGTRHDPGGLLRGSGPV